MQISYPICILPYILKINAQLPFDYTTGNSAIRWTLFASKLIVKPDITSTYLSKFEQNSRDPLRPSMRVSSTTRELIKRASRRSSRRNKHKSHTSTKHAKSMNKIVSGSTHLPHRHPWFKGKISKRSNSSSSGHNRPYKPTSGNLQVSQKPCKTPYRNGNRIGKASATAVKTLKNSEWSL